MSALHNWYTDDAEYVSLEEIQDRVWETQDAEPTDAEVAAFIASHGLTPATCNLCDRPLKPDACLPLCDRCSGTARAHARLIASADPDAELDRAVERRMGR